MIEPWTAGLVNYGARIINHRLLFAREFEKYVKSAYQNLVQNHEEPELTYCSIDGVGGASDEKSIAALMYDELEKRKFEERKRGSTLVGPHRDDIHLSINGVSVQQFASQGQHKTMLVALKIAEFFYLKERRDELPVLLLDDVFSELDDRRSRLLLNTIASLGQILITTTEVTVFHNAISWNERNRKFLV